MGVVGAARRAVGAMLIEYRMMQLTTKTENKMEATILQSAAKRPIPHDPPRLLLGRLLGSGGTAGPTNRRAPSFGLRLPFFRATLDPRGGVPARRRAPPGFPTERATPSFRPPRRPRCRQLSTRQLGGRRPSLPRERFRTVRTATGGRKHRPTHRREAPRRAPRDP